MSWNQKHYQVIEISTQEEISSSSWIFPWLNLSELMLALLTIIVAFWIHWKTAKLTNKIYIKQTKLIKEHHKEILSLSKEQNQKSLLLSYLLKQLEYAKNDYNRICKTNVSWFHPWKNSGKTKQECKDEAILREWKKVEAIMWDILWLWIEWVYLEKIWDRIAETYKIDWVVHREYKTAVKYITDNS